MKKAIIIAATGAILIASVCISAFASSQNTPEEASVSQSAPNKYVIKSESGRLVVYNTQLSLRSPMVSLQPNVRLSFSSVWEV